MKLPPKAKKVFEGILHDVYQWEQELFDGTTATFEMLKRPDSAIVLAIKDNKIILVEDRQPLKGTRLCLPGGRADPSETPLETAKRELFEETGLESDDWEQLFTFTPNSKVDWKINVFIARTCKNELIPQDAAGEKTKIRSHTFEEFVEKVCNRTFTEELLSREILLFKVNNELEEFKKKLF